MEGWEVLNAVPGDHVDHLGNAKDLSIFPDETFQEVYASHVAEHLDYKDELEQTLREWRRVLKPGGLLFLSVPDMDVLAGLFLNKQELTTAERFFVMRMMFGGHVDQYDYHVVGLNEEFLREYLLLADFCTVRRVAKLDIFNDTSNMHFKGVPISLNMIAQRPQKQVHSQPEVGRNVPCPCGSGKKYKHCHGKMT